MTTINEKGSFVCADCGDVMSGGMEIKLDQGLAFILCDECLEELKELL